MNLAQVRALLEGVTPGPWQWFGNTKSCDVYLATVHGGRRLVMDFVRWGMSSAQPRFQVALNGGDDSGVMRSVGEMAKNEEVSKPAVPFGPLFEVPYRRDFVGIGHPDAKFIASARTLVPELLAEVERLRSQLGAATTIGRDLVAIGRDLANGRSPSISTSEMIRSRADLLSALRREIGGGE